MPVSDEFKKNVEEWRTGVERVYNLLLGEVSPVVRARLIALRQKESEIEKAIFAAGDDMEEHADAYKEAINKLDRTHTAYLHLAMDLKDR